MTTNKRRKIDLIAESNNISAFSVRKQLQVAQIAPGIRPEGTHKINETRDFSQEEPLFSGDSIFPSDISFPQFEGGIGLELDQDSDDEELEDESTVYEDDGLMKIRSSQRSREAQLTTINLGEDNSKRLEDGTILIKLAPGEKLVVLGEYGLSVVTGRITIHGAILTPSPAIHNICAPLSHSLPVIRCLVSNNEKAEIYLHQSKSNLRSLRQLSPLFVGLWSTSSRRLGASNKGDPIPWGDKESSFEILLSQDEVHPLRYNPTISPPKWNVVLSAIASEWSKGVLPAITMICGPKASGKSTFSRLLTNRLLTTSAPPGTGSFVAFLDLDPGQPEFSPPGQLSLHLLSKPIFVPSFSHLDLTESGIEVIRAHSIAAVSPASSPDLYSSCVKDLFSHYINVLLPIQYPLVINTPGWILGTGLELLADLIRLVRPTQVIYMSENGPREAIEGLQEAVKPKSLLTLPTQPTEHVLRTSVHLRIMHYMSYFHGELENRGQRVWNLNPITSKPPLEVKYTGKAAGILGVMCLGEQPPMNMLRNIIDGSIVALIVIEDMAAIVLSKETESAEIHNEDQSRDCSFTNLDSESQEVVKPLGTEKTHPLNEPLPILRTPEGIPYLHPVKVVALDPTYSHTIGLALIRGIDEQRQRLQILTPISSNKIRDIIASGNSIILLSGNLDTPGWAYLETFYNRETDIKQQGREHESGKGTPDRRDSAERNLPMATDDQEFQTKGFQSSPWVEVLEGDKGREAGGRVWRVRRDLGKAGGGD